MNKELARQYALYDNTLDHYFDQVLLDLLNDDFRKKYYELRSAIIEEILQDNKCYQQVGCHSVIYTKHPGYDDLMLRLISHYYHIKSNDSKLVYEVELMMIEHYEELCGYHKDKLGYWNI